MLCLACYSLMDGSRETLHMGTSILLMFLTLKVCLWTVWRDEIICKPLGAGKAMSREASVCAAARGWFIPAPPQPCASSLLPSQRVNSIQAFPSHTPHPLWSWRRGSQQNRAQSHEIWKPVYLLTVCKVPGRGVYERLSWTGQGQWLYMAPIEWWGREGR